MVESNESNVRDALNLPYEFTLGGRTFRARSLNLREECELEDALGKDFDTVNIASAKTKLEILWRLLRQTDPNVTREQAAELATGDERDVVARIVVTAILGKRRADEILSANPLSPSATTGGTESGTESGTKSGTKSGA